MCVSPHSNRARKRTCHSRSSYQCLLGGRASLQSRFQLSRNIESIQYDYVVSDRVSLLTSQAKPLLEVRTPLVTNGVQYSRIASKRRRLSVFASLGGEKKHHGCSHRGLSRGGVYPGRCGRRVSPKIGAKYSVEYCASNNWPPANANVPLLQT